MAENGAAPDLLVSGFELIAERGWGNLSLVALAARAGVPLVEVYAQLPGRGALLRALNRRVDAAMLAFDSAELEGLPPRDRAFELLMRRFDALGPFRAGLRRLAREAPGEPCAVLLTALRLDRSMAWLQDALGLRRYGLRARVARSALGAAYVQTLRVWFSDESADLARTMAELDKQLRRVEPFAGLREARAAPPAAAGGVGEVPEPA